MASVFFDHLLAERARLAYSPLVGGVFSDIVLPLSPSKGCRDFLVKEFVLNAAREKGVCIDRL